MTEQSNSAAERSAHVHRGDAPSPADWPVVKMPDGTWKLKSVVALEARIETLEAALKDAAEKISEWGACASPYVQERCNLSGVIARFIAIADGKSDAALEGGKDGHK